MFNAFSHCAYDPFSDAFWRLNYVMACGYGIFDYISDIKCEYFRVMFDGMDVTENLH